MGFDMQDIAAYIIVSFAAVFAVYRIYRFFSKSGNGSSCGCSSGCSTCDKADSENDCRDKPD